MFLFLGHSRIHKAGTRAGAISPWGASAFEGVHCRMAEVFHAVFVFADAVWTARDCIAGEDALIVYNIIARL